MASKERPPMGHTGKDSPLDGLIDKVEEKRRGVRSPVAIDKVIDKAQESGLTGKLAHNVRKRFSGHLSRKRQGLLPRASVRYLARELPGFQ